MRLIKKIFIRIFGQFCVSRKKLEISFTVNTDDKAYMRDLQCC